MSARTLPNVVKVLSVLAFFLALSPAAEGRPLKLSEIAEMGEYLTCVEGCDAMPKPGTYEQYVSYYECLSKCGYAPRLWEKNGIIPVNRMDQELALLEFQHVQSPTPLVCYGDEDETIVIPGALCSGEVCQQMPECTDEDCAAPKEAELECEEGGPGGPVCWWPEGKRPAACPDVVCEAQPVHTFQECADADEDGLPAWLEEFLQLDPNSKDYLCNADQPCSFDEQCVWSEDIGAGFCELRDCQGQCVAFHLAMVAQDDQEVIVHVNYDFTPVPARALDLYITYDQSALTLADARRLAPLKLTGKDLATTHLADKTLRLSVFDTGGTHPIPTGPIIELVFQRHTKEATLIAFSKDDDLQVKSVAPLQGSFAVQEQLKDDAIWGSGVLVPSLDKVTTKLRLWYGFDSVASPLNYSNVPTAQELCEDHAPCSNEPDDIERAKLMTRLEALQQGMHFGGEAVEGLSGSAAYLDGASDHLRLPVHYREPLAPVAQSFSMSVWFYSEGNSANEMKKTPQILYQHAAFNERTRFGLALRPQGGDLLTLVLFSGDMLSKAPPPTETIIADGILERTWHHAGFALDSATGKVDLYFDGKRVGDFVFEQPPAAVSCPQFFGGTNVGLHNEGDVLGGRPPEFVYLAREKSNLFKIHRMDPSGLSDVELIGDPSYSFRDPDYSPIVDKIVYSANVSGNFEIWLADGDGTNRQQLTVGFGNASLGSTAHRPRWAPDASAIVFDSNVFDALAGDNDTNRVRHLYYIGYNPVMEQVDIETPSGLVFAQLDYDTLVASQIVGDFRVTGSAMSRHHSDARWLTGRDLENQKRGELLVATVDVDYEGNHVHRLTIDEQIPLSQLVKVPNLVEAASGLTEDECEIKLRAAHHATKPAVPQPIITQRLFYERSYMTFEPTDQFDVMPQDDGDELVVTVDHTPSGYGPKCWDTNHNDLEELTENLNGDDAWDELDCHPYQVRNLYIEFDPAVFEPIIEDEDGNANEPGALLEPLNKELDLHTDYSKGRAFVRVEVRSPLNAKPIGSGTIAKLHFKVKSMEPAEVDFSPWLKDGIDELLVKDLLSADDAHSFDTAGYFEWAEDAVFSPKGERLLIYAISISRPILLRTPSLLTASGAEKILPYPQQLRGFDWVRRDQFMACNWVGGYQHPQNKAMLWGLRGGMDDMKIYTGLRDPDAFRSEAERGRTFLESAGLDGQLASKLPTCSNDHLECPAFHLCVDSECVMVACDPEDPYSCAEHGGRCTLRPVSVEQEFAGPQGEDLFEWVCAADCNVDAQCYQQECLNGPCRFCDPVTLTCIECRHSVKMLGEIMIAGLEGCPDQKSFRCESGSCVTDCYDFADDQSVYLCDPALEYCDQGECVLHDWSWWDLAPASFQGGTATRRVVDKEPAVGWHGYTMSVDQRIPIEIAAYGVADYNTPPEVVVEATGGPFFADGEWRRIGEVVVTAKSQLEAQTYPLVLTSPYPFNALRLRLVTSPYDNVAGAATGFDDQEAADFCLADLQATAEATGGQADPAVCFRTAQGSRYGLGYRAEIPWHEAVESCKEKGASGCPMISATEHNYLYGGNPAAMVLEVTVDGGSIMNSLVHNKVCAYGGYGDGAQTPWDQGAPKKVMYGDISTEISPQKGAFCAADPEACASPGAAGLVEFDTANKGFVLLNCNVFDPAKSETAEAVFSGFPIIKPWPASAGAIIQDTGDMCMVEVNEMLTTPCYEWDDGKSSMDPDNSVVSMGESIAYADLDFGLFRSFGHDEGFDVQFLPSFDVHLAISGYQSGGLQLLCGDDAMVVPDGSNGLDCPGKIKLGRKVRVKVKKQPSLANHKCAVLLDETNGAMPQGGITVEVLCGNMHTVGGTAGGLTGGVVKLLGTLSLGGGSATAKEVVAVAQNGAFGFATPLPQGGKYEVKVQSHPIGQLCKVKNGTGTMGSSDISTVKIECEKAVAHSLSVTVASLLGKGLELLEKETGTVLTPTGDGQFSFKTQFYQDAKYAIVVTEHPVNPPQTCSITSGGSGTMPNAPHVGAHVSCDSLDTFTVSGQVLGLQSNGLGLVLNASEKVDVAKPPLTQTTGVPFSFATGLVNSASFKVTVDTQPTSPVNQQCDVFNGESSISGQNFDGVMVVCKELLDADSYFVGGTVSGLSGAGLQLELKGAGQKLEVAESGNFVFKNPIPNYTDYEVGVSRHPGGPVQKCQVTENAFGTTSGADISNVVISCVDASRLTVELLRPDSAGAPVQVMLFTIGDAQNNGKLVGVAPDKAKLNNAGVAVFTVVEPGKEMSAMDVDAHVLPGSFYLYVFINHDCDTKPQSTEPLFNAGDFGGGWVVATQAGQTATKTFDDFKPLEPAAVYIETDDTLEADLNCYWTPPADSSLVLPAGKFSPILALSSAVCDPDADDEDDNPCHPDGGKVVTGSNGAVPGGGYWFEVTCWVDNNENGVVDSGDLLGEAPELQFAPSSVDDAIKMDMEEVQ